MDTTQQYEKLEKELRQVHSDVIKSKEELTEGINEIKSDFKEYKKDSDWRFKALESTVAGLVEAQKTNGNRTYDWVKTIVGGAIVGIIVFTFGYVVNKMNNSNNVDNKELINEIRGLKEKIK